ncbi:hypothetical protein [Cerasicoccus maritimus]|uniref:hypothetical protein n=1 Tax=Cerasicoccus maritimus TaxID=490089 RepID=UPI00285297AC|nr:hypothetical protein [Cerasicoccus maritimus]
MADAPLSENYRLPRGPLIEPVATCMFWCAVGVTIIAAPIWPWNLIGFLPLGWAYWIWRHQFLRQWRYVIAIDEKKLSLMRQEYAWSNLSQLKIEQNGLLKQLRLTYQIGPEAIDVVIPSNVIRFDELARHCFDRYLRLQRNGTVGSLNNKH